MRNITLTEEELNFVSRYEAVINTQLSKINKASTPQETGTEVAILCKFWFMLGRKYELENN